MDTQLASQIREAVSNLTQKEQLTLRGVANSKKFSSFSDLANKNPLSALEIIRKRFPKLEIDEGIDSQQGPLGDHTAQHDEKIQIEGDNQKPQTDP